MKKINVLVENIGWNVWNGRGWNVL